MLRLCLASRCVPYPVREHDMVMRQTSKSASSSTSWTFNQGMQNSHLHGHYKATCWGRARLASADAAVLCRAVLCCAGGHQAVGLRPCSACAVHGWAATRQVLRRAEAVGGRADRGCAPWFQGNAFAQHCVMLEKAAASKGCRVEGHLQVVAPHGQGMSWDRLERMSWPWCTSQP